MKNNKTQKNIDYILHLTYVPTENGDLMPLPTFEEVHIENTNACGYKCIMCPREQLTRPLGYMSLEDFALVLERIAPFSGLFHLHGFGEALLDRRFLEKISLLKQKIPSSSCLVFTTLGVKVKDEFFTKLIESGLDHLAISLYGSSEESYAKVHGYNGFALVKKNLELLSQAMQHAPHFKPYVKVPAPAIFSSLPLIDSAERHSFYRYLEDLGFEIRTWQAPHNYGSGRSYNTPSTRACPVISGKRRHILNISWNLDVLPCAYDFNGTIPFGNLREHTLEEIFSSPAYFKFLLAHQTLNLSDYKACQNCEKLDYE